MPWELAVHLTRVAGVQNINGGDTRFDPEFPSYASVAPIGRQVGKERQIYVSTSNENTYTDSWTQNYSAFRYLRKTLDNSETPLRLKPFTIYYHMYSGERDASLRSLLSNFDYARHTGYHTDYRLQFLRILPKVFTIRALWRWGASAGVSKTVAL